jgi:hypothetical protein
MGARAARLSSSTTSHEELPMISRLPLALVLRTNALTSGLTGVLMAVLASPLTDLTGLSTTLLRVAGVGLVPFALAVEYVARNPSPTLVRLVSTADFTWVVLSIVLVIREPLTTLGVAFVLAIAAVVELFGTLQLLRLRPNGRMLTAS